jgi:hypothetical protein
MAEQLVFDLQPVVIDGATYIKVTHDEMLKVIVTGVQRVLASRRASREKWANANKDTERQRRSTTKPLPEVVLPSLISLN